MSDYIKATLANMNEYGGPGTVALDPSSGETFSATAGDYFWLSDDEALTNDDGEELILAVSFSTVEPLAAPVKSNDC